MPGDMFKRMNALDHLHTEERRLGPAYGLWALGGVLGAHRIYLRRRWDSLRADCSSAECSP